MSQYTLGPRKNSKPRGSKNKSFAWPSAGALETSSSNPDLREVSQPRSLSLSQDGNASGALALNRRRRSLSTPQLPTLARKSVESDPNEDSGGLSNSYSALHAMSLLSVDGPRAPVPPRSKSPYIPEFGTRCRSPNPEGFLESSSSQPSVSPSSPKPLTPPRPVSPSLRPAPLLTVSESQGGTEMLVEHRPPRPPTATHTGGVYTRSPRNSFIRVEPKSPGEASLHSQEGSGGSAPRTPAHRLNSPQDAHPLPDWGNNGSFGNNSSFGSDTAAEASASASLQAEMCCDPPPVERRASRKLSVNLSATTSHRLAPPSADSAPKSPRRRRPRSADTQRLTFASNIVLSDTVIGSGAYGTVLLGVHKSTGELVAVKRIHAVNENKVRKKGGSQLDTIEQIEQLASEIRLMKQLDHPNIVKYLHAERQEQQLLIYMELMSGGSLASLMKKFTKLPESVMRVYMRQVLVGLAYLHQRNVVHRDIKADNILMASDGTAKISDFGTSREFNDSSNVLTVTGTPWFMAPEVINADEAGQKHGAPADIWSIGCTMLELVTGHPPFSQEYDEPVAAMFQVGINPAVILDQIPADVSDELRDVLHKCFAANPDDRPTAEELLDFEFFDEDEDDFSECDSGTPSEAPSPALSASASPTPHLRIPPNLRQYFPVLNQQFGNSRDLPFLREASKLRLKRDG